MHEHFHLLLVMLTAGIPCQIQLEMRRPSALLSVYCVHVLVFSYRFYRLKVISKCDFISGLL